MARPGVEVQGLRQLRKTLRQAGDDMADLKAANLEAAQLVATAAAARAPRGATGALAADVRPTGTKTAGIVRAGRARLPYAGPIHWGWPQRPTATARGGPIPANPFLIDAASATERTWGPLYERRLETIVQTIEGK